MSDALVACPACMGAMPEHTMGYPLQVAHRAHGVAPIACPPCEAPEGHQYDDDRYSLLYGLADWSPLDDPCIWCDHEKCATCPPPRGGSFAEEHAAGREKCWNDCDTCKPTEQRTVTK